MAVYGVGTNDADYVVQPTVNGRQVICKFYKTWSSMLLRCYSKKYHQKKPTYINCTVCEEWLTFSNFRQWMASQDWKGKVLDKDIIIIGNKTYSPDTCVFVSSQLNMFLTDRGKARGEWLIGVHWSKKHKKFTAQCKNPFVGAQIFLGYFDSEIEAHIVWKKYKHSLALQYAATERDLRVIEALRQRFL